MKNMHRYRTLVIVLCVTVMLPLGLGLLYSLGEQKLDANKDVAVFTPSPRMVKLSSEEVVDYLSELPLQLKFSRVTWQLDKLIIDVKVAATIVHPEIIYHDIHELLRFAFIQTSNVDRLQLRVVIQDDMAKKRYVLLGMDAQRSHVDVESLKLLQKSKGTMPKELEEAWRIIYTPHWDRQFPAAR